MDEEKGQSGQIFSPEESSSYAQAAAPGVDAFQEGADSSQSSTSSPADGVQPYQGDDGYAPDAGEGEIPPPPSFVDDSRKKYILMFFLLLFVLFLVFFIFQFVKSRLGKKPSLEETKVSLTYWGLWEDEVVFRPLIDEYQKTHPSVTIAYISQDPIDYRERLVAAIERGDGPDIFRFHNTWVPMLTRQLAPIPPTIYSQDEFQKTFYPVAVSDLKIGDSFYGIPLEIDGLVLFSNDDLLSAADVRVPETWVDVQEAVEKLTVVENGRIVTSAIALGTAENIAHFSDILGLMLLQNGVRVRDSLFSCSDSSTTSCSVEALTFYRKFAEAPTATWDDTLENSLLAFAGGKVAMILAPSWQAFSIQKMNPDLAFSITRVPQLPCVRPPCSAVEWASYWVEGVSVRSKNTEGAWEFLKFLSSSDSMQKLYAEEVKIRQLFGEPYSRTDLASSLSQNPYVAPVLAAAASMQSFSLASNTNDGETGIDSRNITYLKDAVNSLASGTSAESALRTADQGFKQVLQSFAMPSSSSN